MCGIVGYTGCRQAQPILLEGLEKLAYRGYDSAGAAVMDAYGRIRIRKAEGKLINLQGLLAQQPLEGCMGIAHTRWATHGEPSVLNAHPHTDGSGRIAVVHNGVIENEQKLRRDLEKKGSVFISQTDTEVIAHLLASLYDGSMIRTIRRAMEMLEGSYAIGVICEQEPHCLYCARRNSPLVMAMSDGEGFMASDVPALLSHTDEVLFLQDGETGAMDSAGLRIYDSSGRLKEAPVFRVPWKGADAEKNGYAHFMLKEIHEQPEALEKTLADRLGTAWIPFSAEEICAFRQMTITGCGTAAHAGLMGRYALETLACIPTDVQIASEYRRRLSPDSQNELVIAVSQSGETADTLAAFREAVRTGASALVICNAVGSTMPREAGEPYTLYTRAGPEMAVASTKACLTQAEVLLLFALAAARIRKSAPEKTLNAVHRALEELPSKARETFECERQIRRLAGELHSRNHVVFIGRGLDYAVCAEAALKLKEVAYVFSEAYPAGELKHGPIALLQEGSVVLAVMTQPETALKSLCNLQEAAARGALTIAVCTRTVADRIGESAGEKIIIPDSHELTAPLLAVIPLQLFAYYMAAARGCDVDQPRNLAKSVTVE